ncbi:MAG TPA: hypothetical protein VNW30_07475 [Opitutaceae bacterium]|jgi:hypothetical protein|nr:hypothetical protein [Opitutaceae bacterium]
MKVPAIACPVLLALFGLTTGVPIAAQVPSYLQSDQLRRQEILNKLPLKLLPHWRKYGDYDFKQHGSLYVSYTSYMFGAIGAKVGLSKDNLMTLVDVAAPRSTDVALMVRMDLPKIFLSKKKYLEQLRSMTAVDGHLARIANDYTALVEGSNWPKDKAYITSERWQSYKDLFKLVGITEGFLRSKDNAGADMFVMQAEGLCVAGSGCGFIYSPKKLEPLIENPETALDKLLKENPGSSGGVVYQKLDGDWYSFYEMDW